MKNVKPLFCSPFEHTLEMDPVLALGLSNAMQRFLGTRQPLEYFTLVVEDGEDEKLVTVSFIAKLEPGKRGLGSANRLGEGVTYRLQRETGEVVEESLHR